MLRPHPHLYEINTWPWLESLSRRAGRPIRLGDVPDAEWSRLRDCGIDLIYLMGIWQRSRIGRDMARAETMLYQAYTEALPGWQPRDIAGSAYCISDYEPDARIGTWDELDAVRATLHDRGMRLVVDFVPNHTGFDHQWIAEHPDRYVCATEDAFRRSPALFRQVETRDGPRYIACGRDPYFPPWVDVAQLNYANPDTRASMIDALRRVARHADGARCDMAMLVLSDVFPRTWGELVGPMPPGEFWADAVAALPGFLLLAEVYWDLEWRLQQLGFDFTYDKRLYDHMLRGSADDVRAHLAADQGFQRRSARFIENHDEPRSAAAFGGRLVPAAVAMSTLPGLRFYHEGQFDGRRARVPVQLGAAADEPIDLTLRAFYDRLLGVVNDPVFHTGEWQLLPVGEGDEYGRQLIAWRWALAGERRLVVVNFGATEAQARVTVADLPDGDAFVFEDLLDGRRYRWTRGELDASGLYVQLAPGRAHLFRVMGQ